MACPQTENGFTMIANELYDALNSYNFPSASPLKLVHIVIRKTYGFKKKEDYISLTQFEKSSKLSRPTVVYWLNALVKSLLLVKGVKLSKNGYTYGINKDFECWKPLVNPLKLVKPRQFTSKPPLTATSKPPLTHKRKKETITKEIVSPNGDLKFPLSFKTNYDSYFLKGQRQIQIVGLYASFKEITFGNKDQLKAFLGGRIIKAAQKYVGYSDEQIKNCFIEMNNTKIRGQYMNWTLETAQKFLTGELY